MIDTTHTTPAIARNILRDLYSPCLDSVLSWNACAEYTTVADLSDEDAMAFLSYILAGLTLSIREDANGVFHPGIIA